MTEKQTSINPVLPGFYPDPSVCRVGQDYYLVTSTFEYFPAVPIFQSRDLIHWRQIGHWLRYPFLCTAHFTRSNRKNGLMPGEQMSGAFGYSPIIP